MDIWICIYTHTHIHPYIHIDTIHTSDKKCIQYHMCVLLIVYVFMFGRLDSWGYVTSPFLMVVVCVGSCVPAGGVFHPQGIQGRILQSEIWPRRSVVSSRSWRRKAQLASRVRVSVMVDNVWNGIAWHGSSTRMTRWLVCRDPQALGQGTPGPRDCTLALVYFNLYI